MSAKVRRAKRAMRAQLGEGVRRRRLAKGLTLRELAARARLSVPHLSAVERGLRGPRPKMVARIARALGTSASALSGWPAPSARVEALARRRLSPK